MKQTMTDTDIEAAAQTLARSPNIESLGALRRMVSEIKRGEPETSDLFRVADRTLAIYEARRDPRGPYPAPVVRPR